MSKHLALLGLTCVFAPAAFAGGDLAAMDEDATEPTLDAWGQVQVWGTVLDQDATAQADPASYGDPELDPGFNIPRGRMGLFGSLPSGSDLFQAQWAVAVGVGSVTDVLRTPDNDVQLVDAYGRILMGTNDMLTSLTVGQQKAPLSREQLMSSRHLVFQDRGIIGDWLSHGRDTGATLAQQVGFGENAQVAARLGAYNGNGSFLGDTDPGVALAGRLEFELGDSYRTWSPTLDSAIGVGVNAMSNPTLGTKRDILGGDVLARYKWITWMAEYATSGVEPGDSTLALPSVSEATRQSGLTTQLSVYVPFDDSNGLEVAGRFATFDDAATYDDNGDVQLIDAGLTWRNPIEGIDVGAGYIHRVEVHGRTLPNDSVRVWLQARPEISIR